MAQVVEREGSGEPAKDHNVHVIWFIRDTHPHPASMFHVVLDCAFWGWLPGG